MVNQVKPAYMSDEEWARQQELEALPMSRYGMVKLSPMRFIVVQWSTGGRHKMGNDQWWTIQPDRVSDPASREATARTLHLLQQQEFKGKVQSLKEGGIKV